MNAEVAGLIKIHFDKLYRCERQKEHCSVAVPLPQGELTSLDSVVVRQNGKKVPLQGKITSRHQDGSVCFMFLRFLADLPANQSCDLECLTDGKNQSSDEVEGFDKVRVIEEKEGFFVDTGALSFTVHHHSTHIFEQVDVNGKMYHADQFVGPLLKDGAGNTYEMELKDWQIVEEGPLVAVLKADGTNRSKGEPVDLELMLTIYAGKPWIEVSYRIINTTHEPLKLASLVFYINEEKCSSDARLTPMHLDKDTDSTGCGDGILDNSSNDGPIFHTRGTKELDLIARKAPVEQIRTMIGSSNYKTDFYIGRDGSEVNKVITAEYLVKEANEHFAEVLYGTFFADRTTKDGGVCVTIFQAQQNYPKAVKADAKGIAVMLVPDGAGDVVMQSGMAREQKILLHFHSADEPIAELDNRSLIYQMPDRPYLDADVYRKSGAFMDIFTDVLNEPFEINMAARADGHARCYGMLNWGDAPDAGYTTQGRGNGEQVWVNNEYDYPHSCALQYVRTGIRRFLDYNFVAASHWMDVDVCHFSDNPLHIGGQWEHTAGHCKDGIMVCSHEWVEGLLDYYHFSGDERGLKTAIGIGENVMRLLDTPMYQVPGEANARETGWALRTLTALYAETWDSYWLSKCDWILDNFRIWEQEYGGWLAPYTDNTVIRTGFMIGVAVGSIMRYYRLFPSDDIKQMLLGAIDDVIDNCILPNGLFFYKELPSLARNGNNTLLLELLACGFELTKDVRYLSYGMRTFHNALKDGVTSPSGKAKRIVGDAVIGGGASPKNFGQCYIPMVTYFKAVSEHYSELVEQGYVKNRYEYDPIFT